MQWVTDEWPAWPTTISGYITEQERLILRQTPYQGCPDWGVCLTTQVKAAAVQNVHKAALEGPTSPIEAHSCDLHILDSVQDSQQVTCMTMEDRHQAQQVNPTLSLVITRLWDGTLGQWQSKQTDSPELSPFSHEWNHLWLWKGQTQGIWGDPLPAGFASCTQSGHSKGMPWWGGHLGLECMLDLMCDQFHWPCMAAQVKEHIDKCHPCLTFKAKQPKAPLKTL